jgi:hypothetical protein
MRNDVIFGGLQATRRTLLVSAVTSFVAVGWSAMAMTAAAPKNLGPGRVLPALAPATHWISGVWIMQPGYNGGDSTGAPRARIARSVDGQLPPLLPGPAAILEKRIVEAENGKPYANTAALCLPQGTPYMLFGAYNGPIQILESVGQVTIISEEFNEVWWAYLGQKHPAGKPEDIEPTYHGDSVARWQNDKLVIDSIGINTRTTLDTVGTPHSDALHVITTLQKLRGDPNTLEFLITIDDAKTFSHQWTRHVVYKRAKPGERVREDHCENQHVVESSDGHQIISP